LQHAVTIGRQLLASRTIEPPIEEKSVQEVGDLAAAVRRSQHDDPAKLRRPVLGNIDSRQ
jgi:hypothetical protein